MTLNEILKARREEKRISLHSAHKETKISLIYLESLEAGRWEVFPAAVYLLGFLRKYAAYLGLDPDEIIRLYQKELESVQAKAVEQSKRESQIKKQEDSRHRLKAVVLLFFILLLGGWWLFTIARSPQQEKKKLDRLLVKKKLSTPSLFETESLNLKVQVVERVWIRIVGDKKLLFEGFLPPGYNHSWNAKNEFMLRIGNVHSIRLALNGHSIDPRPGAEKDVNELLLTPRSLHEDSPDLNRRSTEFQATPIPVR